MTAANITSKYKSLDENNILDLGDIKLLKSKAIYGANASGKSNITNALVTFIAIVNQSFKDDEILKKLIESFKLSSETENKPCFFQLRFILKSNIYRYGFEADEKKIYAEWLFESKNYKNERKLFIREGNKIDLNVKSFKEGEKLISLAKGETNELLNERVLFLTAVKALNGAISMSLVNYISKIFVINGLGHHRMHQQVLRSLKEEGIHNKIMEMLKIADTGIDRIELFEISEEDVPKNAPEEIRSILKDGKKISEVFSAHPIYNLKNKKVGEVEFLLAKDESQGSIKMFELSIFIIKALEEGRPLFIDEFDARFHPELTKKLIELFHSKTNKLTQFIFITHDTGLLSSDILRKDQIAFVEKNKYGASRLYSLIDFKGVRNDASLEKDYSRGKFGAVPYIGNFESVIE